MQNSDGMQKKFKMHAVSITPYERCMQCHWHRMHDACGVIDTACTCACGVNDTTCTVHAVSLIPHAWCMRCHWYRMHGVCIVIDTACKIWHCMHGRRTIRMGLAAFKGNIYQKHICSRIVLPHH
jgi:hypothetical protein